MTIDSKKPRNRIAELRKSKKLTIQQVADGIGVSNGTISRYEQGTREPKLETWIKLADFFDVPVPYLQGISDFTKKDQAEIDRLRPEAFDTVQRKILNQNLAKRVLNFDADISFDTVLKHDYKGANQIIDILFGKDGEKYKAIISDSKFKKQSEANDFPEPLASFMYLLEVLSEMFFSAKNNDDISKKYLKRLFALCNMYDKELVNRDRQTLINKGSKTKENLRNRSSQN